jgi:hypothetical protein
MPRTGLNIPLHPADALAQSIGRQIALQRPAPSAKLADMADIHEGVGKVYSHAEMLGGEGPRGYPVTGWSMPIDPHPRQVSLARTSLDDYLRENAYGDAFDEIRQSLLDLAPLKGHVLAPDYTASGGLKQALERPLYVATIEGELPWAGKGPTQASGETAALPHHGVVQLSPSELRHTNSGLDVGLNHEVGHVIAPPGPVRSGASLDSTTMFRRLTAEHPELGKRAMDKGLGRIGRMIQYRNRPPELMANAAHMRRLEYGLTGNTMTTPEKVAQAFDRWLGGKPAAIRGEVGPGGFGRFEDPIMQHGPNSGQPATNFEDMRESFRHIYDQSNPKTKRVIQTLFPRVASTQEGYADAIA